MLWSYRQGTNGLGQENRFYLRTNIVYLSGYHKKVDYVFVVLILANNRHSYFHVLPTNLGQTIVETRL